MNSLKERVQNEGCRLVVRTIAALEIACPFCLAYFNHQPLMVEEPHEETGLVDSLFCPHCQATFHLGVTVKDTRDWVEHVADYMKVPEHG